MTFLPRYLILLALSALVSVSFAADTVDSAADAAPLKKAEETQTDVPEIPAGLAEVIERSFPAETVSSVAPSVLPGIYEIVVPPQVFFASEDGRYLVKGQIVDLTTRRDIAEGSRKQARLTALDKLGESKMVVFSPEKVEYSVTVFSDLDCGYCRLLHKEMADYHKEGIEIRYLLYPRSGVRSPSYGKTVSTWCADDRKAALTRAKLGQEIEEKNCKNPIREIIAFGRNMQVRGTPAMVLPDGTFSSGYKPAKALKKLLVQLDGDK